MPVDMEAIAARLQRLEDLEDIRGAVLSYCNRIDAFDLVGLADVFTTDAVLDLTGLARAFDGTYVGRTAIIDDFYARSAVPPTGADLPLRVMTGHLTTNLQIELDGDEATTISYFFEIVDDLVLIGTYQHLLRREPDRWRFAKLRISVRYRGKLEMSRLAGLRLDDILADRSDGHRDADPGVATTRRRRARCTTVGRRRLSLVSAHRITFVGPPALALQVVTALADGDGVDLTSSEPPKPHGHGTVTLDVTVDGDSSDVAAAVARVRGTLPDGASVDLA